jgi:hypothetical protein
VRVNDGTRGENGEDQQSRCRCEAEPRACAHPSP